MVEDKTKNCQIIMGDRINYKLYQNERKKQGKIHPDALSIALICLVCVAALVHLTVYCRFYTNPSLLDQARR